MEQDNKEPSYKDITGHNIMEEHTAYDKGREDEQSVIIAWIEKWDGKINSALGDLLNKKFQELQSSIQSKDIDVLADEYAATIVLEIDPEATTLSSLDVAYAYKAGYITGKQSTGWSDEDMKAAWDQTRTNPPRSTFERWLKQYKDSKK